MEIEIHEELEKLKTELETLSSAVEMIDQAKVASIKAIEASQHFREKVEDHFSSIAQHDRTTQGKREKSVDEFLRNSQIKQDDYLTKSSKLTDEKLSKIQEIYDAISNSQEEFKKETYELLNSNSNLITSTNSLIKKIDSIDFPSRLDKLDLTVSAVNQGIQNLQGRLESMERNLKDDLANRLKLMNIVSIGSLIGVIVVIVLSLVKS